MKEEELREKIAEIILLNFHRQTGYIANQILNLPELQSILQFQEQLKELEVVEKCKACVNGEMAIHIEMGESATVGWQKCIYCHGTGIIRRPFTIADLIKHWGHYSAEFCDILSSGGEIVRNK